MRTSTLMTPRPVPRKLAPALAALLVLGVALAVFLIAGWDVRGWAIGAVLWAGLRSLSLLLEHVRKDASPAASSGLQAFELAFKALAALVVLVALAATEPDLALPAILVFALAYTAELGLSLATYFGSEK
ncbi:MAG TPA: hypothetical protein VFR32_01295 [Gaiellaceae bacterium]|nr:hypothetical protein [Gaiellaceae bacterium]